MCNWLDQDVMMPAYNENRLSGLFFVSYMTITFFFLFNVILAIVVNAYKDKTEVREEEIEKERQNYQKGEERFRKHMDYDDNVTQLVRTAKKMKLVTEEDRCLDFQEATLLSEDFLCATNTFTSQLLKDGSEQLVKEATEIMGRLIDSLLQ